MTEHIEFKRGCELFNLADFFEAHEVWEELWVPSFGEKRHYLQGLIQIAAALHHAQNENWKGTRKLLASGFNYLEKGKTCFAPGLFELVREAVVDFEIAAKKKEAGEDVPLPFFKLPEELCLT